jgi:hypothetical protein
VSPQPAKVTIAAAAIVVSIVCFVFIKLVPFCSRGWVIFS